MPSPFPGMNPYFEHEAIWHNFHQIFISICVSHLAPQTAPKYIVMLDFNIYIHEQDQPRHLVGKPDVYVVRSGNAANRTGSATIEAPVYLAAAPAVDIEKLDFVEIRDTENRELVTVIELLSPTNKRPGPDRDQYIAKRMKYFASDVNLVELDLLRGFERMPQDDLPECDYCVMLSRVEERERVGVWPIALRERLPIVPIPLRAPDSDARLDLQAIVDRIHDEFGFAHHLYTRKPQPPLRPDDDAWARGLIRK